MKVIVTTTPDMINDRVVNLKFITNDGREENAEGVYFADTMKVMDAMRKKYGEPIDTYTGSHFSGGTNGDFDRNMYSEVKRGNEVAKALRTGNWNDIFGKKVFAGFRPVDIDGNEAYKKYLGEDTKWVPKFKALQQEMYDLKSDYYRLSPEEWWQKQGDLRETAEALGMTPQEFIASFTKGQEEAFPFYEQKIGSDGRTMDEREELLMNLLGPEAAKNWKRRPITLGKDKNGKTTVTINLNPDPERSKKTKEMLKERAIKKAKEREAKRNAEAEPSISKDALEAEVIKPGDKGYRQFMEKGTIRDNDEADRIKSAQKAKAKFKKTRAILRDQYGIDITKEDYESDPKKYAEMLTSLKGAFGSEDKTTVSDENMKKITSDKSTGFTPDRDITYIDGITDKVEKQRAIKGEIFRDKIMLDSLEGAGHESDAAEIEELKSIIMKLIKMYKDSEAQPLGNLAKLIKQQDRPFDEE